VRQRTVEAKVPAGVKTEHAFALPDTVKPETFGGPAGDLYVVLHREEHAFLCAGRERLHCVIPISFTQAALGRTSGAHPGR